VRYGIRQKAGPVDWAEKAGFWGHEGSGRLNCAKISENCIIFDFFEQGGNNILDFIGVIVVY